MIQVTLNLDEHLYGELDRERTATGRSMSEVITRRLWKAFAAPADRALVDDAIWIEHESPAPTDDELAKQLELVPADMAKRAEAILRDLCDDFLDVQIGTAMFWKSDAALEDDAFAQYVHARLLDASRAMGYGNYDSSNIWDGDHDPAEPDVGEP